MRRLKTTFTRAEFSIPDVSSEDSDFTAMATTVKSELASSRHGADAALAGTEGDCADHRLPRRDVVDYELLLDCVHCGLCLEACPTYVLTRAEMDSPRGRIYLMKALADGQLELDADAVRHLDLCLECRGCETACPSGVHYGKLIEQARVYVERNYRRGIGERLRNWAIDAIFPYPGAHAIAARAAAAGRSIGPAPPAEKELAPGAPARLARPAAAGAEA